MSAPHFEWPSKIDLAISAGYEPGEDYNAPIAEHLRAPEGIDALAVLAAQADFALGVIRCAHPHCRTSLTDEDMSRCPHDLAFCEMCVWEDGCGDCADGAANEYGKAS